MNDVSCGLDCRYAFSGVAFSAAKPSLDFDWCKECDRGLPAPDAVIFLDIPVEKASLVRGLLCRELKWRLRILTICGICRLLIQRGQYGEERYEKPEMQARVRANFDRIMAGDDTWHRVDATGTIEQVSGRHCWYPVSNWHLLIPVAY